MTYPDKMIRGIPNNSFIDDDGFPSAQLFYFESKNSPIRGDNYIEMSINWFDDDDAIKVALDQKKEDTSYHFKYGVAIVLKNVIDNICRLRHINEKLTYERNPLPNNKYHGNLLLDSQLSSKKTMKKIAATIALHVSDVIPRE